MKEYVIEEWGSLPVPRVEGVYRIEGDRVIYISSEGDGFQLSINPEIGRAVMLRDKYGTYIIGEEIKKLTQEELAVLIDFYGEREIKEGEGIVKLIRDLYKVDAIIRVAPYGLEIKRERNIYRKPKDIRAYLWEKGIFLDPKLNLNEFQPQKPKENLLKQFGLEVIA